MTLVHLTALLLVCVTWPASADDGCPGGWYRYGLKCYGFYDGSRFPWRQSRDKCVRHGNVIASPRTREEKEWLRHVIKEKGLDYWIGLRRVNGKWVWPDNQEYEYDRRDWVTGSPIEDNVPVCAHASACTGGKWKEAPCSLIKRTLCSLSRYVGQWGDWAAWSRCSKTCGTGRQSRTRKCNTPEGRRGTGRSCPGHPDEYRHCNTQHCPLGWATCHVGGDPHYTTFDRQRFNFQGGDIEGRECKFLLAGRCKEPSDLPPFKILAANDHRGGPGISWVKAIELHYNGHVIRVDQSFQRTGFIYVDGVRRSSTNYRGVRGVVVTAVGKGLRLSIDDGLVHVAFSGQKSVVVGVDKCLKGANGLCGLCGNYDGNKRNDLYLRNGTASKNRNDLGWSYQEPDQNGRFCQKKVVKPCEETDCKWSRRCHVLTERDVFGSCPRYYNARGACEIDMCCSSAVTRPDKCTVFRDYVRQCARIGHPVPAGWEERVGCNDPECPENAKYDRHADPCQETCTGVIDGCKSVLRQGRCVCNPGHVWFNNQCIPKGHCGCVEQTTGEVHPIGSSWLDRCCRTRRHCRKPKNDPPVIETYTHKCHRAARCSLVNGSYACRCTPGFTEDGQRCTGFNCPSNEQRLYEDPQHCKKYYYCIGGESQHHTCSGPLFYDDEVQGCILTDDCPDPHRCAGPIKRVHKRQIDDPTLADWVGDGEFDCPREHGAFPNPGSCTQFYTCADGIPVKGECQEGMHFNPSQAKCMDKEKAGCRQ